MSKGKRSEQQQQVPTKPRRTEGLWQTSEREAEKRRGGRSKGKSNERRGGETGKKRREREREKVSVGERAGEREREGRVLAQTSE
jgi:hypothetical protein